MSSCVAVCASNETASKDPTLTHFRVSRRRPEGARQLRIRHPTRRREMRSLEKALSLSCASWLVLGVLLSGQPLRAQEQEKERKAPAAKEQFQLYPSQGLTRVAAKPPGPVNSITAGTGLLASPSNPITDTGTIALDTVFTDGRYLKTAGGTMTGILSLTQSQPAPQ